jgi:hypothetical protein
MAIGFTFLSTYKIDIRNFIVLLSLVLYIISVIIYLLKIKITIKNCKKISKKEKEYILSNIY